MAHRFVCGALVLVGTFAWAEPEPPAPEPTPAVEPTASPAPSEPPKTGAVSEPAPAPSTPAATPQRVYRRHHPWQMLVAGAVTFFVPYFVTVGFAASYESYNANAARVGYIPIAGPFLGRERINDKDLKDGYDPGLLVDGIVQVLTANLLIAGIIYCAVGEKRLDVRLARVRPLIGVGQDGARLGAAVSW